jgi:hypothetical protein
MFGKIISSFVVSVTAVIGGIFGSPAPVAAPVAAPIVQTPSEVKASKPQTKTFATPKTMEVSASLETSIAPSQASPLTDADLLALADNKYALGNLPLGDDKYVTSNPKKGYIYLCRAHKENPGSMVTGPWMHGDVWNSHEKIAVLGSVSWPNATFSNTLSGDTRTLSGNGLPIDHTTGIFPVASNDPAHAIDPNPNTISIQNIKSAIPANPVYSDTPYCMGGEVGVMLSGVPLFNGFDAGLRDAAAHELQDSCDGHPQGSGEYHYHNLSSCIKDVSVKTVIGYAYDGFPITGPMVSEKKYLTTEDLDVCHGVTSDITVDGKSKTTYHYVMTEDFPYSASCFRGKPVTTGASVINPSHDEAVHNDVRTPPAEAVSICSGKPIGSACSFNAPVGIISGLCKNVPEGTSACVPTR